MKTKKKPKLTQEITMTLMNQTVDILKKYEEELDISKGEIIDRCMLEYPIKDPEIASFMIIEYILTATYTQDEERFKTTAYKIIIFLCDMLMSSEDEKLDLDRIIKDIRQEYDEYEAVLKEMIEREKEKEKAKEKEKEGKI